MYKCSKNGVRGTRKKIGKSGRKFGVKKIWDFVYTEKNEKIVFFVKWFDFCSISSNEGLVVAF